MANFVTRTINSTFETNDGGIDHADLEAAYRTAVLSGIAMVTDEVLKGKESGIIAIHVEDKAGRLLARGVVSLATSTLVVPAS